MREEVTGILHMAATTGFDQTPESAAFNVVSTRRVLDVARSCRRLSRLGLVSTAFVAGRRSGLIGEDELEFGEGFSNEYERSKALAEREGREAMGTLPIAVYRLSIVVGRREDGRLARSGPFSPVCRLLHRGLLRIPPSTPSPVDMIPADFAAQALIALMGSAFVPGATYHVCAGPRRSPSLHDLLEAIAECIRRADPSWQRRGFPPPFSADAAGLPRTPVGNTGDPRLQKLVHRIEELTRPLDTAKFYDTTRFDAEIVGLGLGLAHPREWISPLVGRALAGRLKVTEGEVFGHFERSPQTAD